MKSEEIIDFAIKHPAVRGINFQPAFHAGRHMQHDPMQRMTNSRYRQDD